MPYTIKNTAAERSIISDSGDVVLKCTDTEVSFNASELIKYLISIEARLK